MTHFRHERKGGLCKGGFSYKGQGGSKGSEHQTMRTYTHAVIGYLLYAKRPRHALHTTAKAMVPQHASETHHTAVSLSWGFPKHTDVEYDTPIPPPHCQWWLWWAL
jgi:hypothetical protein